MQEIEIQVQVENVDNLKSFLTENAQFISEKRQVDEYFTPAHRDFIGVRPISEWLRLRNEGDEYSFNYKQWHYDDNGHGTFAEEFETVISDIESAHSILQAINCRQVVVVDKSRQKWMLGDYEIALDSVTGLGEFIEIEYKGKKYIEDPKVMME